MTVSLAAWVAASLVAHSLLVNLLWLALLKDDERAQGWTRNVAWQASAWLSRAAFFVGVPFLALIAGVASPARFALDPPIAQTVCAAVPLTLGAFVVGVSALWLYRFVVRRHYPPGVLPAVRGCTRLTRPWGASFLLLDALCLQAHWAFYRAGASIWLGDALAGTVAGVALVAGEWLVDPAWWRRLSQPGQSEDDLLLLGLLLLSAALYTVVPNFWIVLLAHILLWLAWLGLMQVFYRPLLRMV